MEQAIKDTLKPFYIVVMSFLRPLRAVPSIIASWVGFYLSPVVLKVLPQSYMEKFQDYPFRPVAKKTLLFQLYISAKTAKFMKKSEEERAQINREMWLGEKGKIWFEGDRKRRDVAFILGSRERLIHVIERELKSCTDDPPYTAICEIGTGDGRFLDFLASRFPNIKNLVGVDLNPHQMDENKQYYRDKEYHFLSGRVEELLDQVRRVSGIGRILFVCTRTFTMFTQRELESLFGRQICW